MIQLDESADGRKIDLPSGEKLEINLKENSTAGFRWHLDGKLEPQLTLEGESFISPQGKQLGQSGTRQWKFKASEAGTVKLEFQYQRGEENPTRKLTLSVQVT